MNHSTRLVRHFGLAASIAAVAFFLAASRTGAPAAADARGGAVPDGAEDESEAVAPVGVRADSGWRGSLLFLATYDRGVDAEVARGDARLRSAASLEPGAPSVPGVAVPDVALAPGMGRHGGALRFLRKSKSFLFYRGEGNVPFAPDGFEGTVSFWLRLAPDEDLEPGYCDPIQITDHTWNDGALWVDFDKELPRAFRLGCFADLGVWNADGRKFEELAESERPMVTLRKPPFARDRWTHVVFTFQGFNTSGGSATLYLDGAPAGRVEDRGPQTFTWELEKLAVRIGIGYTGLFDELAIFSRALAPAEVRELHALPSGLAAR